MRPATAVSATLTLTDTSANDSGTLQRQPPRRTWPRLGDISMLAIVHRIFELYPDRLDRSAFPRLNAWWEKAMARPAANYVYADGTDETPKRPPTKSIAGIAEYRI